MSFYTFGSPSLLGINHCHRERDYVINFLKSDFKE